MIYVRYRSAARSVLTRSIAFREAFAYARHFTFLEHRSSAHQVQSSVEETGRPQNIGKREGGVSSPTKGIQPPPKEKRRDRPSLSDPAASRLTIFRGR
jgi:hypothetical protein